LHFTPQALAYVRGEGGAILLLKALDAAERDGDQIYGVIRGGGYRHGGHTTSLTVPSATAQATLIADVYHQAKIDVNSVSYIETHGSGTPVGDPIEIAGLKKAFASLTQTNHLIQTCGLGSVKSNIGHLEAASRIAGIVKVLMAMKHRQLPGTLHHNKLNPNINLDASPFYIVAKNQDWIHAKNQQGEVLPLRAGVSSFGLVGESFWIKPLSHQYKSNVEKSKTKIEDAFPGSLQNDICQLMAEILQVSASHIEAHVEMSDLGFDSLGFRELCSRLNDKLGLNLTPVIFYEVHTLEGLIQYLRDEQTDFCERYTQASNESFLF
jgi:acyl carrier protein